MANKQTEQECLDRAIDYLKAQTGIAKYIGQLMSGQEIARESQERPDFVRYSSLEPNHIVGVEHFMVDMMSDFSNQKVRSETKKIRSKQDKIFHEWNPVVQATDSVPYEAATELFQLLGKRVETERRSNYRTLLKSFEYSLQKHNKGEKPNEYQKQLKAYGKSTDKRTMIFLIEVRMCFRPLILNNLTETIRVENGLIPIVDEMIDLLKQINEKQVQYFVLCFESTKTHDRKYYAFRSGSNIEHDLQKQGAAVFQYIGENKWLECENFRDSNLETSVDAAPGGYQVIWKLSYKTVSQEIKEALTMHSVCAIQFCKSQGIKYIVTPLAQEIENTYGKHIVGWRLGKDNYAKPVYSEEFKAYLRANPPQPES